jgi:Domain of unknown function (DUF4136)
MRTWIIVVALLVTPAPTFTQNVNVDLCDARSQQLVWRGTGTGTASDKPDTHAAKMNKAVAQMFEQYPPTQK